jgi:hypothetical protein
MRNRPKPPPHIQKRKDEEAKKNAQRKMRSQTKLHPDIRNMTGNDFGTDLHTEGDAESFKSTHYSLKPSLNKIKEEREEIGKNN